jgi:FkbM family methyltransferase
MMMSRVALLSLLSCGAVASRLRNASNLVHPDAVNATIALHSLAHSHATAPPCQCQANGQWPPTTRVIPKCIFIDLGAANANSFQQFLAGHYGPVANCPSGGQWEAYLVEANPQFNADLQAAQQQYPGPVPGTVYPFSSTAAYSCVGQTSFSIDPDVAHNRWGSSMKRSFDGSTTVTVPTLNVMELIAKHTIQADWVMLKVDIEGAEFDLIPCLSQSNSAHFIDRMYLEEHTWLNTDSVYTKEQYAAAKQHLITVGVDIPAYFSQTL